jgi:hypothetical protein
MRLLLGESEMLSEILRRLVESHDDITYLTSNRAGRYGSNGSISPD